MATPEFILKLQPAPGLLREILEETGVVAVAERLVSGETAGPVGYPSGDICHFLTLVFRCRHLSGEARVNDEESLAVGWFRREDIPDLMPGRREAIERAALREGALPALTCPKRSAGAGTTGAGRPPAAPPGKRRLSAAKAARLVVGHVLVLVGRGGASFVPFRLESLGFLAADGLAPGHHAGGV
jgi:hypothetical protein